MKALVCRFSALALGLALLVSLPAAAQVTLRPPVNAPVGAPVPPPEYGTSSASVATLGAFDFDAVDSATPYTDDGNVHRYFNAAGGRKVWIGTFHIPSGTTITGFGFSYCDSNSASMQDYTIAIYDFDSTGAANFITSFGPTTNNTCSTAFSPAVSYNLDANQNHFITMIVFQPEVIDGTVKMVGASLSYKRRISTPPATATFGDVSNASPIYKFVEALAAAGITGGCGNGNYCPNDPVTRGQMAVFISTALGLHFPN